MLSSDEELSTELKGEVDELDRLLKITLIYSLFSFLFLFLSQ